MQNKINNNNTEINDIKNKLTQYINESLINKTKCLLCNMTFTTKGNLSRHLNNSCIEKNKLINEQKYLENQLNILEEENITLKKDKNTQNILMTPTETKNIIKTVHLSTKSLSSLTGTFNSISSLSTSSNPQDLERFQAWDLDNVNIMAIQGVTLLPYDYVSGTPIEVEIHYYGESGLAGNIIFGVGLCGDVSGNDWGNEADTQYSSATYAFGGAIDTEYSFSVSLTPVNTLNPYDPICIIIYRNAANAGDTYIADVQITKVSLKYTSNNI
jgi:hypothetical protein